MVLASTWLHRNRGTGTIPAGTAPLPARHGHAWGSAQDYARSRAKPAVSAFSNFGNRSRGIHGEKPSRLEAFPRPTDRYTCVFHVFWRNDSIFIWNLQMLQSFPSEVDRFGKRQAVSPPLVSCRASTIGRKSSLANDAYYSAKVSTLSSIDSLCSIATCGWITILCHSGTGPCRLW